MTSFRSYLVDALIQWLLDNNHTPHVIVQCDLPGVDVPKEFVKDEKMVLNVSPQAVSNFSLSHESMELDARFNGVARRVKIPPGAIVGVFAKGSTVGLNLEPEISPVDESQPTIQEPRARPARRANLKFVE